MLFLLASIIDCAILVGFAFILGKIEPSMPNKVCRFVSLFVLSVPFNLVINYVNVWGLGYHKMGWTALFIISVLLATYGTFLPPQPRNSSAP
jgi:hypothetical protein